MNQQLAVFHHSTGAGGREWLEACEKDANGATLVGRFCGCQHFNSRVITCIAQFRIESKKRRLQTYKQKLNGTDLNVDTISF